MKYLQSLSSLLTSYVHTFKDYLLDAGVTLGSVIVG